MLSTMGQSCRELEGKLSDAGLLLESHVLQYINRDGQFRCQKERCYTQQAVTIKTSCRKNSPWKCRTCYVFSLDVLESSVSLALSTMFVTCKWQPQWPNVTAWKTSTHQNILQFISWKVSHNPLKTLLLAEIEWCSVLQDTVTSLMCAVKCAGQRVSDNIHNGFGCSQMWNVLKPNQEPNL